MTPLRLALISIAVGVFPLLVAGLASAIANTCGCTLNEAGAEKCIVFGREISGLLYSMFMFAWLGMFTVGIAILGLTTSAIWAFMK